MANTGNTQQIIDYGAAANDGTGDPLRTAFIKTDENFSNIWAAGPVGSNITIANNTIQNDSTNGNIVLKPNGVGVIQANASILPSIDGARDLGSSSLAWRRAYINILTTTDLDVGGNLNISGDATIQGNLTVEGDTIQIGNITTDTLLIQLANAAANAGQANGAGVTVGANDDIATMLYNSSANTWNFNIGLSATGNISAPYFIGNGSQLTGMYGNANVVANLAALDSNPVSTTGNVSAGYFIGDGSQLTGMYGNANVVANLAALSSNPISTTGNISSGRLLSTSGSNTWSIFNDRITSPDGGIWRSDTLNNDEYITSRPDGYINLQSLYANSNVASEIHLEHGLVNIRTVNGGVQEWTFDQSGNLTVPGNILPNANGVYSLGNNTSWWANLWVANNTIYLGGVPLGMTSDNVLTVNGNAVLSNDSDTSITTTGNITANIITATGAINVGNMSIGELPGYITADANIGMVVNVSGPDGGFVVDYLKEDGNANTSQGELAFSSETGNATYRISLTDDAGDGFATKIWRFDGTGNLNLPTDGNIIIDGGDGVIGPAGDNLIISWDNENLTLRSIGDDIELQTPYSVRIETGDAGEGEYSGRWDFSSDNGKLNSLPVNPGFGYWNAGHLQFVGNSSGDNNGYTTLRLVPDDTLVGNDQYLIIDPTAPGHIHIRAGGTQDNSLAELIMGGEYSHFKVGSGANATVYINANSHIWWFNQDGTVQLPPSDYGYAQFYTGGGANLYLGSSTYPVNITGADGSIIAPNNITANGNVTGDVGFFNDINLNNAGTNRMLYVDGDRNIYDTDFSYDAGNSSISGSGNITAGYFIGDGSQLTGLPAQYGDSNVATFLAAYGSNTISTSGNVTAGNFLGSGTNVDIIAGSYDWTFDNAGTLTLPGNTFAVNYANGSAVSLGGNYGDANVVTLLGAFGSNNITTTGNVTATNFIGNVSLTGNVQGTSANVTLVAGSYSTVFDNTGTATFPGNIVGNTAGFAIGYRDIPQVSFTGDATLAATAAGQHYYSTLATANTLTIANNTSVSWTVGTAITVVNRGTGNITVAQGSGVSLYLAGNSSAGNRTVTTYGMATLLNVAANVWMINGTGVV